MKKALIYTLSLALALSLAACSKAQPDQQEPNQPDPATTSTSADISTPEPPPAPPTPEPLADVAPAPQELSQDELHQLFQYAYDSQKDLDLSDIEVKIGLELDLLQAAVDMHNRQLPSDYEEQYRAWRPADPEPTEEVETSQPPQETAPQQPPKTSTNTPTPASSEPEQQKPAEQEKPISDATKHWNGFNSYEEYITHVMEVSGLSREEAYKWYPDQTKATVDQNVVDFNMAQGAFG